MWLCLHDTGLSAIDDAKKQEDQSQLLWCQEKAKMWLCLHDTGLSAIDDAKKQEDQSQLLWCQVKV